MDYNAVSQEVSRCSTLRGQAKESIFFRKHCPSQKTTTDEQYASMLQEGTARMPVVQLEKISVDVPSQNRVRSMVDVIEYGDRRVKGSLTLS